MIEYRYYEVKEELIDSLNVIIKIGKCNYINDFC